MVLCVHGGPGNNIQVLHAKKGTVRARGHDFLLDLLKYDPIRRKINEPKIKGVDSYQSSHIAFVNVRQIVDREESEVIEGSIVNGGCRAAIGNQFIQFSQ